MHDNFFDSSADLHKFPLLRPQPHAGRFLVQHIRKRTGDRFSLSRFLLLLLLHGDQGPSQGDGNRCILDNSGPVLNSGLHLGLKRRLRGGRH